MSGLVVGHFPPWQAARRCTSGPQPGNRALMAWFIEEYGDKGGFNLGIFNCRSVRGGATTSVHGEGRADDLGFPVGDRDGDECLRRLLAHVGALGIQAMIYERVIYSAKSPHGRHYDGLVPHLDHIHTELTWEAARNLTLATIRRVMNPEPKKPGSRPLRIGMKGEDVRWLQRKLNQLTEWDPAHLNVDGYYGPATKRRVLRYERNAQRTRPNLVADGVVGKLTWQMLGIEPTF